MDTSNWPDFTAQYAFFICCLLLLSFGLIGLVLRPGSRASFFFTAIFVTVVITALMLFLS